jgi:hypothetical protein
MSTENNDNTKVTTEYTLATGAKDTPPGHVEGIAVDGVYRTGVKEGHKCCGGCCDMRRAVIIVNLINAFFLVLGILAMLTLTKIDPDDYTDDEVEAAVSNVDKASVTVVIVISLCKLGLNLLGVYGAITYNIYMVGASFAVYVLEAAMSLVVMNVLHFLYSAFFAYPHVFFIREVKAGVMTKENYPINEEMSCCCV